jgi:hypothetical protein
VFLKYFKACSLKLTMVFGLIVFASSIIGSGTGFLLADFTKHTEDDLPKNKTGKSYEIGIYTAVGLIQCWYFLFIIFFRFN